GGGIVSHPALLGESGVLAIIGASARALLRAGGVRGGGRRPDDGPLRRSALRGTGYMDRAGGEHTPASESADLRHYTVARRTRLSRIGTGSVDAGGAARHRSAPSGRGLDPPRAVLSLSSAVVGGANPRATGAGTDGRSEGFIGRHAPRRPDLHCRFRL